MDCLEEMFDAQKQVATKFLAIEADMGFRDIPDRIDYDLDLNDRKVQKVIRERAWRLHEECCEFLKATPTDRPEELADITHFLIEFTILAGVKSSFLSDYMVHEAFSEVPNGPIHPWENFVLQLGMTVNQLKNRPWKQSHKEIDKFAFRTSVTIIWLRFAELCASYKISLPKLYGLYFHKNEKNHQRIADGV